MVKPKDSPTGIRTRVVWVKTTYPDQLDYWGEMRRPGIKPGSRPWQGRILSLYYRRLLPSPLANQILFFYFCKKKKIRKTRFELVISCV